MSPASPSAELTGRTANPLTLRSRCNSTIALGRTLVRNDSGNVARYS